VRGCTDLQNWGELGSLVKTGVELDSTWFESNWLGR